MSMRNPILIALLATSSFARAQPAPPEPPAPPPAPPIAIAAAEPAGGPPQTGFQLQARMPTQFGLTTLITPGFTAGYRSGNLVIGAELGFTAGKVSDNNNSTSVLLYHLMPVIYLDVWQSTDGRARLNLVGGAGYGQGKVTTQSSTSTSESSASFIPLLAGIGGDYYLHKNFAIGLE